MPAEWRFRGRNIDTADVNFIRDWIDAHPGTSRRKLSRQLCEAWGWKQANGTPRDMVFRSLLLLLHRAGAIELPTVRQRTRNPLLERLRPEPVIPDTRSVRGPLHTFTPLTIEQVRRSPQERLFNSLVEQYHYLGYEQPVGEHLKYLVRTQEQVIACAAWSSAPRHLGVRDRFIGWNEAARKRNIGLIAYNTRLLILPWVQVQHLASHLLGQMARQVPLDFQQIYAHPIWMLETFVDPARFRGTCYRAANWVSVGYTTGRGKDDLTHQPNRSIKEVLVLPLHRRFREWLNK